MEYKCASCGNERIIIGRNDSNEPIAIFCFCGATTVINKKEFDSKYKDKLSNALSQELQEDQGIIEEYI